MKAKMETARLLAPVGITAGLATFFFGEISRQNHWNGAWTNIISGIVLIVIGFVLLFIYLGLLKSQEKEELERTLGEVADDVKTERQT